MSNNDIEKNLYLGMRSNDLSDKMYARFWNPDMRPLPAHAIEAVVRGPVASSRLIRFNEVSTLLDSGMQTLENGYSLDDDGLLQIAVRTEMPGASPAMVDWWFGWHSDEPQRYKLWHPHAHVHAEWSDTATTLAEKGDRARYVGRTSNVHEYLGSELGHYAIQFVSPGTLGLDESLLADAEQATAICARVGFARYPLNFGYLVHNVRRVPGGSEMRSRFWVGGPMAAPRDGNAIYWPAVSVARMFKKPQAMNGQMLLVHCAEEMAHLATFLPELYRAVNSS